MILMYSLIDYNNCIKSKIRNEIHKPLKLYPCVYVTRCNKKSNDVALLKTARQLRWSRELQPACLPNSPTQDFSGTLATVAGWGFTNEDRQKGGTIKLLINFLLIQLYYLSSGKYTLRLH